MKCGVCKKDKEAEDFCIDRRNKRGRNYRCKACDKKWRENNIDSIKASQKKRKDKYNSSKELRDREKQRVYEWRKENWASRYEKRKEKQLKKFQFEKEKELRMAKRKYRKENITPYIKWLRSYLWYTFKIKRIPNNKELRTVLGCDYDTLEKHIEKQFKEGMTWNNKGVWHIDHIIPFSSVDTLDEIKKLCHYKNIQPLWDYEHKKKSVKEKC